MAPPSETCGVARLPRTIGLPTGPGRQTGRLQFCNPDALRPRAALRTLGAGIPNRMQRRWHVTALALLAACSESALPPAGPDRKSTRLNSSHSQISYAVFCLKKKNNKVGIH